MVIGEPAYCHTCRAFGDHHTDQHPGEYAADPWGEDQDKDDHD